MDVILHIGAHRTASTSFQTYLRENAQRLSRDGIGFWGPRRTRSGGVFSGIMPVPSSVPPARQFRLARGRILTQASIAQKAGCETLIVSDENMIGSSRRNLQKSRLYPDVGERLARYLEGFDGRVSRIALSIRSLESFWASQIAFSVERGYRVPDAEALDRLVTQPRAWRDVITDMRDAAPDVEILVMPYESFGGRPERKLGHMVHHAIKPPLLHSREWLNRRPDLPALRAALEERGDDPSILPEGTGRWNPFDASQTAALRETYADDLYWLRAGADGLATLTEETGPDMAGMTSPDGLPIRGQTDGIEERRMAGNR
ncbi:hypothetical protein [Litorivita sp. NS0012-18]|uniref:hypothetical protein n=1 Tax=Litorivita sp. NS0012-18 TaxID=3127655 RepID=UPI0031080AFD